MLPFVEAMSCAGPVLFRQPVQIQQLQGVAHGLDPSGALGISLASLADNSEVQKLFRLASETRQASSDTQQRQRQWQEPLQELAAAPVVMYGSPVELSSYKEFVRSRIAEASSAARANWEWRDSGLLQYLEKAQQLVEADCTALGRQQAIELLGFCSLAERSRGGAASQEAGRNLSSGSSTSGISRPALPGGFKVPAPRDASGEHPLQTCKVCQPAPSQPESGRKHHAPKRRATPQVLSAPPRTLCSCPSACSESQVTAWLDCEGTSRKRQRTSLAQQSPGTDEKGSLPCSTSQGSSCSSATQVGQPQPRGSSSPPGRQKGAAQRDNPGSQQQQHPQRPPGSACRNGSSSSGKHAEAIELVKVAFHENNLDASPAPEVLLFAKDRQMPMAQWKGVLRHKRGNRVVELCQVALQVPELYVDQFPRALYALDICHRRQVSLGRHVVCRAHLGPLNERQLAGLKAMAKSQLVAIAALQTAELHLVPYFDNKNQVRVVGFLKILS